MSREIVNVKFNGRSITGEALARLREHLRATDETQVSESLAAVAGLLGTGVEIEWEERTPDAGERDVLAEAAQQFVAAKARGDMTAALEALERIEQIGERYVVFDEPLVDVPVEPIPSDVLIARPRRSESSGVVPI